MRGLVHGFVMSACMFVIVERKWLPAQLLSASGFVEPLAVNRAK